MVQTWHSYSKNCWEEFIGKDAVGISNSWCIAGKCKIYYISHWQLTQ